MTELATTDDLIGTWRLESWTLIYDDGRPHEYPLGNDAEGFILYTGDGYVSALLSRSGRATRAASDDAEKARAHDDCFGYVGRFTVRDGSVFHAIEVSTNAALAGVTSTRKITRDGHRLILAGPDFTPGAARSQRIVWQRAAR